MVEFKFEEYGLRVPTKHVKGWGYELWPANSPLYCMKILHVDEGKKCSIHFHRKKHETFYPVGGLVSLEFWPEVDDSLLENPESFERLSSDERKKFLLSKKECFLSASRPNSFVIPPLLPHRFTGMDSFGSELLEVSTQHFEEDSYRILRGD